MDTLYVDRLQVDWRAPSMDGTHPVMYSRETLLELATNPYAQVRCKTTLRFRILNFTRIRSLEIWAGWN